MKAVWSKLSAKPHFKLGIAAVVMVGVIAIGYVAIHVFAATSGQLYLTPATGSYTTGQAVNVLVYENSSTDPVNAIQANFTYTSSKLQFQSIDGTGSGFSIDATSTGGSGTVSIARGTSTPVTGVALVATVHFTALAAGSATLSFTGSSALVRSTDNANILTSSTGATYTLSAPATPTPTPTPTPVTHTPTPAITHTPTPVPGSAKTPTPAPKSATPTLTTSAAPAAGGVSTPAATTTSTPTDQSAAPGSEATAITPTPKPIIQPAQLRAAAAIGIPVLVMLVIGSFLMFRRLPAVGAHGSDQTFVPPQAPTAPVPPPSTPEPPSQTYYPEANTEDDQGKNDGQ